MAILPPTFGQVSIELLGALRVACYSVPSKEPEMEGRNYLNDWLASQHIAVPVRQFGFDVDVTETQKSAGLRGYEVWATVPETVKPSGGVTIEDFTGGLYASALLVNPFGDPYANIPPAWKALHEWVIGSDLYRGANHQWLEELILRPNENDLKLYYPIIPTAANGNDMPE